MTKKVIINNCYGGPSISAKAVKRIAELQGKECYFFKSVYDKKNTDNDSTYEEISIEECKIFWSAFTVNNPNEFLFNPNWHNLSDEEKQKENKRFNSIYLSNRIEENREDKLLIQVIEELKEEGNGYCAELKIIEIPDDVQYKIEEYDGLEHISEIHRTWR